MKKKPSRKNLIITENTFFKYQRYEKEAREDIKKFFEYNKIFDKITVEDCDNRLELNIMGDIFFLTLDRGWLVLEEAGVDGDDEDDLMIFDSCEECLSYIACTFLDLDYEDLPF